MPQNQLIWWIQPVFNLFILYIFSHIFLSAKSQLYFFIHLELVRTRDNRWATMNRYVSETCLTAANFRWPERSISACILRVEYRAEPFPLGGLLIERSQCQGWRYSRRRLVGVYSYQKTLWRSLMTLFSYINKNFINFKYQQCITCPSCLVLRSICKEYIHGNPREA